MSLSENPVPTFPGHALLFGTRRSAPRYQDEPSAEGIVHIVWIIIIGFVAGVIARLVAPGPNNPSGFILTTVLGIIGAFVATFLGQLVGWYRPGESAGLIGGVVGAIILLFLYGLISGRQSHA